MIYRSICFTLLCLLLFACGGNDTPAEAAPTNPYETATQIAEKQMEALQGKNDREVLEPAALKAMLPETLLGMPRKSVASNGMGAAGMQISTANATYQNEGERRQITVAISDGMGANMAAMGMVNSFTVDKEEGTKTTKTITVAGKKAIREYDTATNRGSMSVVFAQSIVQIEGRELSGMDELEDAFNALDLSDL